MKIECLFMEESPDINFPYNMVTDDGINSIINKKLKNVNNILHRI